MHKEGISFGIKENSKNWGEHAIKIRDRLHRAHHVARKHLTINTKRRKYYYDLRSNLNTYFIMTFFLPNFPLSTNFIHFGF
jgi:hypothetical protein